MEAGKSWEDRWGLIEVNSINGCIWAWRDVWPRHTATCAPSIESCFYWRPSYTKMSSVTGHTVMLIRSHGSRVDILKQNITLSVLRGCHHVDFPSSPTSSPTNAVSWDEFWFLRRLEQSIGRSNAVTTGYCSVFAAWTWIYSQNLFEKDVCGLQKWFCQTPLHLWCIFTSRPNPTWRLCQDLTKKYFYSAVRPIWLSLNYLAEML